MQTQLQGYYLDGRTASRQAAVIRVTRDGLQIETERRATLWWPYEEIRRPGAVAPDEQMRLEHHDTAEVLLVPASPFSKAIRFAAPQEAKRFTGPAQLHARTLKILGSLVGTLAAMFALYVWGIPAFALVIAPHVPVAWEESLGQGVVESLAPHARRCEDATRNSIINEIVERLNEPLRDRRYRFRVVVVNDPTVNALAAPGGYMLIFRGLLDETQSPEELAAVLAHEMQHILRGHATRQILQHASIQLLLAAITGDASQTMSYGLGAASTLGMLRYSRQYEEEADREAIRMLAAAQIDPEALIRFFQSMKKGNPAVVRMPAYLSTHPNLDARITKARGLIAGLQPVQRPLLKEYNWRDIRAICSTVPQPKP